MHVYKHTYIRAYIRMYVHIHSIYIGTCVCICVSELFCALELEQSQHFSCNQSYQVKFNGILSCARLILTEISIVREVLGKADSGHSELEK